IVAGHRDAVLDALTWLDVPGFEQLALTRARALCEAVPGSPFTRTVLARALASSGADDDALTTLAGVIEDSPLFVPAYDQAVQLLNAIGQIPQTLAPLVGTVTRPELFQAGLATPSMVALAT